MRESELRNARDRILHRNNAQGILQALATLEERRAEFTTRWLWELIQNARDFPEPSRRMTIRSSLSLDRVTFTHNGRDFTRDEILSLIYHGSTKQSNPEELGKFGTGFLSTHLLSRRVRVKGTLRDESSGRRGFEFDLDRSGDNAEKVGEAMQRSFEALERSLECGEHTPTDWTEYVYEADGPLDTEKLEADFPFDALPYVLIFDAKVEKIEIQLPGRHGSYARSESEELHSGGCLAVIEGIDSVDLFVACEENGIHAAAPVAKRPDGSYEIMPPGDVPRLYKFLPLVNSTGIGLPAVFHSREFSTTENRDGLEFGVGGPQSELNKLLLSKVANCLLKLAEDSARNDIQELHRLLNVRAVSDDPAWPVDRSKYADIQHSMIRGLAAIPLVRLETGDVVRASEVDFPLGDEVMTWKCVYEFGSDLASNRAADPSTAEECSGIGGVKNAINAIVDTIDALYRAIYKKKFPAASRGLNSRLTF